MSKRAAAPDVMFYAAIVLSPRGKPKQTEFAGADDFNLIGEEAREYEPPPKPDDLTGELPLE